MLIVFLFPVALVMLFQFFSKGVYEVAPLYEEGVGDIKSECPYAYAGAPYRLPDSIMHDLAPESNAILMLAVFNVTGERNQKDLAAAIEQLAASSVLVKHFDPVNTPRYDVLRKCVFLVGGDSSIVLADTDRRIRGYYGTSREEMDRLIVEMKIILKIE